MDSLKKYAFIFLGTCSFAATGNLKAELFFNEKLVKSIATKTSLSPEFVDFAIASSLAATLIASFIIIDKFGKKIRHNQLLVLEEEENNKSDNDVIQEEKANLTHYKELYENDSVLAETTDIETLSVTIKQKNSFPYFIPYRRKIARAITLSTNSLKRINKRLELNFKTRAPRAISDLQQLKEEYEEFIQKLETLHDSAYECIKSSSIENILMWWIVGRARDAKDSLEPNRYFFSYLVEDLI